MADLATRLSQLTAAGNAIQNTSPRRAPFAYHLRDAADAEAEALPHGRRPTAASGGLAADGSTAPTMVVCDSQRLAEQVSMLLGPLRGSELQGGASCARVDELVALVRDLEAVQPRSASAPAGHPGEATSDAGPAPFEQRLDELETQAVRHGTAATESQLVTENTIAAFEEVLNALVEENKALAAQLRQVSSERQTDAAVASSTPGTSRPGSRPPSAPPESHHSTTHVASGSRVMLDMREELHVAKEEAARAQRRLTEVEHEASALRDENARYRETEERLEGRVRELSDEVLRVSDQRDAASHEAASLERRNRELVAELDRVFKQQQQHAQRAPLPHQTNGMSTPPPELPGAAASGAGPSTPPHTPRGTRQGRVVPLSGPSVVAEAIQQQRAHEAAANRSSPLPPPNGRSHQSMRRPTADAADAADGTRSVAAEEEGPRRRQPPVTVAKALDEAKALMAQVVASRAQRQAPTAGVATPRAGHSMRGAAVGPAAASSSGYPIPPPQPAPRAPPVTEREVPATQRFAPRPMTGGNRPTSFSAMSPASASADGMGAVLSDLRDQLIGLQQEHATLQAQHEAILQKRAAVSATLMAQRNQKLMNGAPDGDVETLNNQISAVMAKIDCATSQVEANQRRVDAKREIIERQIRNAERSLAAS